ncbi:MAG: pyruvate dehydrogenase (acetyl-transferring), homodimeric type [Enterobacteriaceae bacterium]
MLNQIDIDKVETSDWIKSIDSVIKNDGICRANFLIENIINFINEKYSLNKNYDYYINSIKECEEHLYPGNLDIEKKLCSITRWNALMIILRASKKKLDLGGHISSFQSYSTIYEVFFNHFFKAKGNNHDGDLIYFQGHSSPGIYARAFLEGRIKKSQIDNFRQEIYNNGLPSYPHPRLMPNFWQFPTVSMGLSVVTSIYQAKFLKYLENRNLKKNIDRTVYVFLGDGEMDEPESKGLLNIASRENLDNLIFIINCNLQRLDGPVLGNSKIIIELEKIFLGSGWEVIKVIWGGLWDKLFKKDKSKKLIKLISETNDGDYQNLRSKDGNYIRNNFFRKYKETFKLVKDMTDEEIWELNHGGHDFNKIYSAIKKAKSISKKPVVILFHTIKGFGIKSIEGKNIAHQAKTVSKDDLYNFKKHLKLDFITDKNIDLLEYIKLEKYSEEYNYLHNRREKLNGYVPFRKNNFYKEIILPEISDFNSLFIKQKKNFSTTVAFVRILNILLKNRNIKDILVPIVADEARTFGMEGLFNKIGIYNSQGQKYIPNDKDSIFCYRESKTGQILQEGINEVGGASSWIAAATSYVNNDFPMIAFYIYYSIFGFQRTGDLFWAAADQQAKGFLIGATAGRTTLNGEGLQHEDGHSHIFSLTIPSCISYDPSYGYELAVIIHSGLNRMYGINKENVYYYITLYNESYDIPEMPKNSYYGICKGMYKLEELNGNIEEIQLIGSGAILNQVRMAAKILSVDYNIKTTVYSATSFTELTRDAQDCERWNMLNFNKKPKIPYLRKVLNSFPIVVATDYIKSYAEQIRPFVPTKRFRVLGTDGFGRSDSRENLRKYFEIDLYYIVIASLYEMLKLDKISFDTLKEAVKKFDIDLDKKNPRTL